MINMEQCSIAVAYIFCVHLIFFIMVHLILNVSDKKHRKCIYDSALRSKNSIDLQNNFALSRNDITFLVGGGGSGVTKKLCNDTLRKLFSALKLKQKIKL